MSTQRKKKRTKMTKSRAYRKGHAAKIARAKARTAKGRGPGEMSEARQMQLDRARPKESTMEDIGATFMGKTAGVM